MNNPDNYFPELNIPYLKDFVRYLIIKKKFENLSLKRVVLYRHSYFSEYFPNVATEYEIPFEFDIDRDKLKTALYRYRRPRIWRKTVEFDVLSSCERKPTILDKDYLHHCWGMDDSFKKVYRNGPPREDFLIEWHLFHKFSDMEMPLGVMIDQPHVTLFDSSGKKGKKQDFQYLFIQEGPAWTIYYEGRPLRGFKGTGFAYIHYLVENQGKEFCPEDLLSAVDKWPPKELGFCESAYENREKKRKAKNPTDSRDIIDQQGIGELKEERNYLKAEIDKAKENNDFVTENRAREKLDEFEEYFSDYVDLHGKSKKFPGDPATKNKERIRKAIERALKKILDYDAEAGEHFKKALSKPDSYSCTFCYNPHPSIAWEKS